MADDKTKRLRTHVVKELYETEGDYTDHLEFTVTVSCSYGPPRSAALFLADRVREAEAPR